MTRLVVSRKELETVHISGPGDVTVRVVEIRGNRVMIAFEAEPDVLILRGEVERKEPSRES